jgi:signal transduction histidine kinase
MSGPLRSVWTAPPASPPPPRRVWRDWLLVGLLIPMVVVEAVFRQQLPWVWLSMVVTLGLVPTVLWRRTHPLLMLLIATGVTIPLTFLSGPDDQFYSSVFLLLIGYCVFRWGSGRAGVIGLALLFVIFTVSNLLGSTDLGDLIGGTLVVLITMALGLVFRFRASARAREIDQAKSLEREQLARDLHDVVAHHVSAIAIRAQAGLAVGSSDSSAALDALRIIETEASRTLTEMRSMVRVLRRDESMDLAPSPRVEDLRGLASTDPSGPVVTVQLSGDVDGVPASVAAAIYRIAQESVTNARRHARHATRINVIVAATSVDITLTVRDNGTAGGLVTSGVGYGITGMTERATILGGTLTAGRGSRGWTVTCVLPLAASAGGAS